MLGEELRRGRIAAGLSQEQLAFRSGLSRPYVSQLERGLKSPTLETLFLLCDAMGASAAEVVARVDADRRGGTGSPKENVTGGHPEIPGS